VTSLEGVKQVVGGVYVPAAAEPASTPSASVAAGVVARWMADVERPRDCISCGACVRACLTGAMTLASAADEAPVRIDAALCSGCGDCVEACPREVLAVRSFEAES